MSRPDGPVHGGGDEKARERKRTNPTGVTQMSRADLGPQTYGTCPDRRCGNYGRRVLGVAHPDAPYVYNRCPVCLATLREIAGQP